METEKEKIVKDATNILEIVVTVFDVKNRTSI
jgi:hypothetical protein